VCIRPGSVRLETKFQRISNDSPFAWYLITDYFMAVDNRAKNMMLATWDGLIWYFHHGRQKHNYRLNHQNFRG